MKAVLISIQPKWVEKIAKGEKTIEVRKSRPKLETPFKVYIYCTIGNGVKGDYLVPSGIQCGKVIGEFVCDKIVKFAGRWFGDYTRPFGTEKEILDLSCLTLDELTNYLSLKDGYAWYISDLKIYDKPKELGEFRKPCYVNEKVCYDCQHTWGFDYKKGCDGTITRPPQSWCYVEKQDNERV